ncbi:MAG: hypothetical protein ISS92_02055 [Candidatus Omnitrophica bacterium]|nr:hypothetical protein [Candidatus Omnitrophota bacterium]
MIKLDISVVLFFYLFFTVIVVFGIWIWLERGSSFNTFKVDRKDMWQCAVCNYVYIDPKSGDFSRCPRCRSINKKGVHKA